VATAFFCWWGAKLKWVSVDDQNLYVSSLTKEISIQLAEVESVDDFQSGVCVRLKADSEFGQSICFMAKLGGFTFGRKHSVFKS
jgi:hypothetical protein